MAIDAIFPRSFTVIPLDSRELHKVADRVSTEEAGSVRNGPVFVGLKASFLKA
jgi:hypothetical protein